MGECFWGCWRSKEEGLGILGSYRLGRCSSEFWFFGSGSCVGGS